MLSLFARCGLTVLLMFVFVASGGVDAVAQGLTPLQVAQIETAGNAVISPDGRFAIYTRSIPADPREANDPNTTELHRINLETGESSSFYSDTRISGAAFRPGHNTVTFLARRSGDDGNVLYEMPVDGGTPTRLVGHETSISAYAWAPNGNSVAFIANAKLDLPESELPYQPEVYEENIANRLTFIAGIQDGSTTRMLVDGSTYLMKWSPDGRYLALSTAPTPHVDDMYMSQKVRVLDAQSGAVMYEIDNVGKIGQIEWSPDGSQIALRAGHDINDPIDGRILVTSSQGGEPRNIYPGYQGKFESIEWTGANEITFLASEGTNSTIGTIAPDGSNFRRIVEPGQAAITSFSRADNGTMVVTASTPQHPPEIFAVRNGRLERLTHHNAWLADVPMGRQEVVTYSPRDGAFEVEGLLIYPVDYQEGTRVPLIVVVHGGPESHYLNAWLTGYSLPGQMAAGRGYAVFYPNYRGSTGRGMEFTYSSQGDLAGTEFDDIVDGVDYLIGRGIVDGNRVGVTGGSYGGYATAWMSTRYSDRFAAGVMFVGISNNISKWGTSDIPEELYHVHSRKRIWDHWQWNLERSPIYYVENAQTPLLIMHGADDTRVHPAQSLELYRHIRVRRPDVPVRLVLYPGEGHGNVRATSRYDYTLRAMQWFDTYLMADEAEMPHSHISVRELDPEPAASR
jgi:dipeptidyl aminopeptidase/acylaminoacyl peptidase